MNQLNSDIAIQIAKRYCQENTFSDYNYVVVGENEKPHPPFYIYELLLAEDDDVAKSRKLQPGEILVKVFENNENAEIIISNEQA